MNSRMQRNITLLYFFRIIRNFALRKEWNITADILFRFNLAKLHERYVKGRASSSLVDKEKASLEAENLNHGGPLKLFSELREMYRVLKNVPDLVSDLQRFLHHEY